MFKRRVDRAEARLRGEARECIHGQIDCVDARLHGGYDAGGGDAAGVMGVEVDRQTGLLFERLDQLGCRRWLAQAGHVFDREDMRARCLELTRHGEIIGEIVFRTRRVGDIAGVTDRRFT